MKKNILVLVVMIFVMSACAAPAVVDINQTEVDLPQVEGVADLEESTELLTAESEVSDLVAVEGTGPGEETHQATIAALSDTELTETEMEGILFMREEEKLARDVYLYLADVWNMNIFANIANSENTHMESVLTLINLFELEDPVQDNDFGVFANQDLQALYDDLIAKGNLSLADAIMVGGAIEEIDILDLQEALAQASNSAVIEVFNSLLSGSYNHLQAFVRTYERQTGETYQPQFLSQEEYEDILTLNSAKNSTERQGMNAPTNGKGQARQ